MKKITYLHTVLYTVLCTVMVIASILLPTGCGESEFNITDSYKGFGGESVSEKMSVYTDDGLIHMYDAQSGQDMVLCSKANCNHEPYDETSNPDPTCEAALNEQLYLSCTPVLCGSFIYLIGAEDLNRGVVYRENLDGSARERLYTFDYLITRGDCIYVRDGKAIATAGVPVITDDEMGGSASNDSFKVLLGMDFETGETEAISEIDSVNAFQNINVLSFQDGRVYYKYSYQKLPDDKTDYSMAQRFSKIYCYDFQSKKTENLFDEDELTGLSVAGVSKTSLCVWDGNTGNAYEIAFDTKEKKTVYEPGERPVSYFVINGKWIAADLDSLCYYLVQEGGATELSDVSSVLGADDRFIEYTTADSIRAALAEDFFGQNGNFVFERKGQ